MDAEAKLRELGIKLPDYTRKPFAGMAYGRMKPFHVVGKVLTLAGHVPEVDGEVMYAGRLGDTLTTEQGYHAARLAGVNLLAGIKEALGDLDRVAGVIRTLNYVVCTPDYHDVHKVANGVTDLLAEVYGDIKGIGCRATLGIQSLTRNHCFETVAELEIA
jgi:enamine deaminase RidA (YjgF/YER057c/UK114 family)